VKNKALSPGWLTSDADEVERRCRRAAAETFKIKSLDDPKELFGLYRIGSGTDNTYQVEIRALNEPINSCDCPDHRINGLGICKHIEAVLLWLRKKGARRFQQSREQGSPLIEIFLDRRDQRVRILWPQGSRSRSRTREMLAPFFNDDDLTLTGEILDRLPALLRSIAAAPGRIKSRIRVSGELGPWLERLELREQRRSARHHFEAELAAGRASLDLCKLPLYPYQQEGMLHLAFTGRALLADEMGLGKTVQAVAACELLRRLQGAERILVVSPASLKGEWEEQIGKFTGLSARIIQGPRQQRLEQYDLPGRFFLANYEQIPPDVKEINERLAPDVVILDEAQRIKNWQTKTAAAIKRLRSPYAFVLTGTPLENRLDEIYSIVQFLDPHLFGPLFRFNRDHYQLDEKGRAQGYKNLDQLHEKLRSIMLRRRKAEVEGQLPGRTVNTYLVTMHKEQQVRYVEYETRMARLASQAKSRPLRKEEMEQLQRYLACMRMLCDTPYILDAKCRVSPKLQELEKILQELLETGDHKIIIFSEWQRMLELVRGLADKLRAGHAWHTGKVPQARRREEIRRFKQDPECRLLLSTDSGSVGLNLQVADTVINLDIPWNPAKLEQRIGRAWRKHQKRPVQVINLVTAGSIEQRMLGLLEEKRNLALGVVDGQGPKEMPLPSGRAAFLERLDNLLQAERPTPRGDAPDPYSELLDDLRSQWPNSLLRAELYGEGERCGLLVVTDRQDPILKNELEQQLQNRFGTMAPRLQLLDRETYTTIKQLIDAGILCEERGDGKPLFHVDQAPEPVDDGSARRLAEARTRLTRGQHKQRMAKLLGDGDFVVEALAPMAEALELAFQALLHWQGHENDGTPSGKTIRRLLIGKGLIPKGSETILESLRKPSAAAQHPEPTQLLAQCNSLFEQAAGALPDG